MLLTQLAVQGVAYVCRWPNHHIPSTHKNVGHEDRGLQKMGRPLESPWGVCWIDGQSFRHASLFHGDRRILRGLPPHNMLPIVEAAGIATTDLRHLLVWRDAVSGT